MKGFTLEDATGLTVTGDIDVHAVFAGSLPTSHPSFAPQRHLDLSRKWQAPSVSGEEVELFIGILSAGNHFAERMAVRKSWMQHKLIRSSKVVARFFVALVSSGFHEASCLCLLGYVWIDAQLLVLYIALKEVNQCGAKEGS